MPKPCGYDLFVLNPGQPDKQERMEVNMRAALVASPGNTLLAVDYCQVGYRWDGDGPWFTYRWRVPYDADQEAC